MAYRYGSLPDDPGFPIPVRKQYFWFYLPFLGWITLIFPLFFIPIPIFSIGPFGFFFAPSTNRRKILPIFRRLSIALKEKPRVYDTAIDRWLNDLGINLLDIVTLGLSNAFTLARQYDELKAGDGDEGAADEEKAVHWLNRSLLLGNAIFILIYILCPGLILEQIIYRIERMLYQRYKPLDDLVTCGDAGVHCQSLTTREAVDRLSADHPLLLYCRDCFPEEEEDHWEKLKEIVIRIAPDLIPHNVQIGFCNTGKSTYTHFRDLANSLRAENISGNGFYFIKEGKLIAGRQIFTTKPDDTLSLGNLALQAIGAPAMADYEAGRVDPPGQELHTLAEALTLSERQRVLILTFKRDRNQRDATILELRETVIPEIREGLATRDIALFYTSSNYSDDPELANWLKSLRLRFQGFVYLKDRQVEKTSSIDIFTDTSDLIKHLIPITGLSSPLIHDKVTLRYYEINAATEAEHISLSQPVIVITRYSANPENPSQDTKKDVLPDLVPAVEAKGAVVAVFNGRCKAEGWADKGVTLLKDGHVIRNLPVKQGYGDGYRYSQAGKELLASL